MLNIKTWLPILVECIYEFCNRTVHMKMVWCSNTIQYA